MAPNARQSPSAITSYLLFLYSSISEKFLILGLCKEDRNHVIGAVETDAVHATLFVKE